MNFNKLLFGLGSVVLFLLIGTSCASSEKVVVPACLAPNNAPVPEFHLSLGGQGRLINYEGEDQEILIQYKDTLEDQYLFRNANNQFTLDADFVAIAKISDPTLGIRHLEIIVTVKKECGDAPNFNYETIVYKPSEIVPAKIGIGSNAPIEKVTSYTFNLKEVFEEIAPCGPFSMEISILAYTNDHCPDILAPSGYYEVGDIKLTFEKVN